MRLFVAVELSADVLDCLYNLQKKLKKSYAKVNWVAKKNLHLTLKFFGDVSESDLSEIKNKLKLVKYDKFKLSLTKIGFYSDIHGINVVWVGITPEEKIVEFQKIIDIGTLKFGGIKLGGHITLGRVKIVRNKKAFVDSLNNAPFEKLTFDVNFLTLFESMLKKEGPTYKALERYPLN